MGRKPKTPTEKVQHGQHQPCRLKKTAKTTQEETQKTGLVVLPKPPKYLCKEGRKIWQNHGKTLVEGNALVDGEKIAFGRYCQYAGLYERLMEELDSEQLIDTLPNGIKIPNAKWKMALDCQDRADRLGKQFGLSPSTRKDVPPKEQGQREHPLAGLLK